MNPGARVAHVIARFRERYGLELTESDVADLERRIRSGECRCVKRDEHAVKYVAHVRGVRVRVVTFPDGCIATVLPSQERAAGVFRMSQIARQGIDK